MLISLILVLALAISSTAWLTFLRNMQGGAARDRAYLHAFYAAEAGVEQTVDFFNHVGKYSGRVPNDYDNEANHPARYMLDHAVFPDSYPLFQPYILEYLTNDEDLPVNASGQVIWNENSNTMAQGEEPVVTRWTYFENLNAGGNYQVALTSKIPTMDLDVSSFADSVTFLATINGGGELARVVSVRLVHPSDAFTAQNYPNDLRVITKVESTGVTPEGIEVRVETLLTENPTLAISSPAAIISEASAIFNGHYNVYWGELWAKDDVEIPTNVNKIPHYKSSIDFKQGNPTYDRWFRLRTQGDILNGNGQFADGRDPKGKGFLLTTETDPTHPVYEQPYHPDYLVTGKGGKSDFIGLENLRRHQSLNFPEYDYSSWKSFFRQYDLPYYWTDSNGTIYGEDENGEIVGKSWAEWFNTTPNSDEYYDFDRLLAFIDSVPVDDSGNPGPFSDGVPVIDETYYPRDPVNDAAALMAEIQDSGQGTHTRGAFFVAADFKATGQGNPPDSDSILDQDGNPQVLMPNGQASPSSFDVSHNGFFYTWGFADFGGNRTFYGSVHAREGYAGSGNPDVYYDVKLKDGSWLNLNQSVVRRTLWDIQRSQPGAGGA
ncbi:MAG: pilus assembly PilX N-terminal domain-containing protein [Sumerlaeia bacterium]